MKVIWIIALIILVLCSGCELAEDVKDEGAKLINKDTLDDCKDLLDDGKESLDCATDEIKGAWDKIYKEVKE